MGKSLEWKNPNDSKNAKEFNYDGKIDEELYFRRSIKKTVILYDVKDKHIQQIKLLRNKKNVFCIEVENALEGICENKRATYKESKWIEIVYSRGNRLVAKKFHLLNSALFTKKNPESEIQGQTLFGKFATHEYLYKQET